MIYLYIYVHQQHYYIHANICFKNQCFIIFQCFLFYMFFISYTCQILLFIIHHSPHLQISLPNSPTGSRPESSRYPQASLDLVHPRVHRGGRPSSPRRFQQGQHRYLAPGHPPDHRSDPCISTQNKEVGPLSLVRDLSRASTSFDLPIGRVIQGNGCFYVCVCECERGRVRYRGREVL